ncbi:hypothetical protein COY59_03790 [Candidatus Gottesmanbacteria bacterium CG_4_10_14_0_8_um_filter_37_24]|uniref:DUF5666 domain-containing protein n=1 Tax=Candidatus Gottesmanbacteria bacterium CG_4_10_14_0_8_um_filter_37_24 TaxID=1974574 RepID=A0A2M7RRB3_9BACT|nr:hypothetical protein [bacterium]PIZ02625.1 MAG: hypothetical protein COY59_03790 [Candidatus Gottesmanbacteria bacterium CG_4_10_14_0_8_um_filter_37_24]
MKKSYLPILLVVFAILFTSVGFFLAQKKSGVPSNVSKDILYITNPVNNFNGKIDKIQGNEVWVSQSISQPVNYAPETVTDPNKQAVIPTPATKTITFKVKIDDKTNISRAPVFVPYLIKQVEPSNPPKLSVKDLKVGQNITINTSTDLRTASSNEILATGIQLPPISNSINGKVTKVAGTTIVIKAVPPMMPGESTEAPKEKEFTIEVNQNTEISRYSQPEAVKEGETAVPKPPTPELVKLEDLKVDMQITVFADVDVTTNTKLVALRIEPMLIPEAPVQTPAVTGPAEVIPPVEVINVPEVKPTTNIIPTSLPTVKVVSPTTSTVRE